jgi:iron complex outermembrane receptor protein
MLPSRRLIAAVFASGFLAAAPAVAADELGRQPRTDAPSPLFELDLEELAAEPVLVPLLDRQVTTTARQDSTIGRSPVAISVLSSETIRRSGARSVMEALRMVPGLHVARINTNAWAIGSRGFNGQLNNKMLVQIDGRAVYTPLFAGTYWDVQDLLLEDIDRIEVIRGPGGSLWGDNAVNGVVNIITKSSAATVGSYAEVGGGTDERAFAGARAGVALGDDGYARFWAKTYRRDVTRLDPGRDSTDEQQGRGGARADFQLSKNDLVTVQGEIYDGETDLADLGLEEDFQGGHLLGRWQRNLSENSQVSVQAYYDRAERSDAVLDQLVETWDFDLQHNLVAGRHRLVWGLGLRQVADELRGKFLGDATIRYEPQDTDYATVSGFVQDEIALAEERLCLTVGTKLSHNDFSGFEFQPTARLLFLPSSGTSLWASVARAVRTPTRVDQDVVIASDDPNFPFEFRSRLDDAELLLAWELGGRAQLGERTAVDVALYYNDYENLTSTRLAFEAAAPTMPFLVSDNGNEGAGYGGEISLTHRPSDALEFTAWYSYLELALDNGPSEVFPNSDDLIEGASPCHQAFLMASWDLASALQVDTLLRYVDRLPTFEVPAYLTADLRVAWQAREDLELSVVGRNLFERSHAEFGSEIATEIQRGAFVMVRWQP